MPSIFNKLSMFVRTIVPDRIPEFNINEIENPICYIYVSGTEATLLHFKPNMQDGEVIKVGMRDNELVFYPANADSSFFRNRFELRTFEFIELITCANLHIIGEKICAEVELFGAKLLEHKDTYAKKFDNAQFSINIIDKTKILHSALHAATQNAAQNALLEIMRDKIIDSNLNLFAAIFPEGIYNVENFLSHNNHISSGMISRYLNSSNLADSTSLQSVEVNLGDCVFIVSFRVHSLLLQASVTKKIYANAEIHIESIDAFNLQPDEMIYENSDISVLLYSNEIIIVNQSEHDIAIENFTSSFECGAPSYAILSIDERIEIPSNHNVSFEPDKNGNFIKNVNLELIQAHKLRHHLSVQYNINGESKKFLSNGSYDIEEILRAKVSAAQDSAPDSIENAAQNSSDAAQDSEPQG